MKLSQLLAATGLTGAERFPLVQGGETKGATFEQFRLWLQPLLPEWMKGDPGPAGNVAADLVALKLAPLANGTMIFDQANYTWTEGDFAGQADDLLIVESEHAPLPEGAWKRETAEDVRMPVTGRTVFAEVNSRERVEYVQAYYEPEDGDDWFPAHDRCLAVLRATVGVKRKMITDAMPTGAWMKLSDSVLINFDDIEFEYRHKLKIQKRNENGDIIAAPAIVFKNDTDFEPIRNVRLSSPNFCEIHGNKQNVTGYEYEFALYTPTPVLFMWPDNFEIDRVIATDGVVNGIKVQQGRRGLITFSAGHNSEFDNGITLDFPWVAMHSDNPTDEDNLTRQSRIMVRHCEASGNRGFGGGNYNSTGNVWDNFQSWNNGNNDGDHPAGACGGMSIECDPFAPSLAGRQLDARCTVINPRFDSNWGSDLFISTPGAQVIGGRLSRTRNPTEYSDPNQLEGNSVRITGAGSLLARDLRIDAPARAGYFLLSTAEGKPSLDATGLVTNCGQAAVRARGLAKLDLRSGLTVRRSNQASGNFAVELDNSGGAQYNQGGGVARIKCAFEDNPKNLLISEHVASVRALGIDADGNGDPGAPDIAIIIQDAEQAIVRDIGFEGDEGANYHIVSVASSVAFADIRNVRGSAIVKPVANAAAIKGGQIELELGGAAPGFAPSRVGAELFDTTGGKIYKAIGTSSAADWLQIAWA